MDRVERAARVIFRGMETWDYGPTTWDEFTDKNRSYVTKVARAALLVADAKDGRADEMMDTFFREMDRSNADSVDQSDIDGALAAITELAEDIAEV